MPRKPNLIELLSAGDLRTTGKVDEVVGMVRKRPAQFKELVLGMTADDPGVRMRASDAVEKLSLEHPDWLKPYKALLLGKISRIEQQEVRWHLAQLIPRLKLTPRERTRAAGILESFLSDKSRIVQTMSLQALADLAPADPQLLERVVGLLKKHAKSGSPAVKNRCGKLLDRLSDTS